MNFHLGLKQRLMQFVMVLLGVILVSMGLEMFLAPHKIIPGGAKGIAVILSHVTEMRMGLFLLFINLPFVIFKKRNAAKTISALFTLMIIAIITICLHPFPPLFQDPWLASVVGGITLGTGVGLVVRFGWYADGINDVALYLKKKTRLSIGEIINIINILILFCGGFLFGWEQAIHSVIAYVLAYQAIQFILDFHSKKIVWIRSDRHEELTQLLAQELNEDIQILQETPVTARQYGSDIFLVISGKKLKKLKSIVYHFDPLAQLVVSSETEPFYKFYKI